MPDISLWMNTPYDWILLFVCALLIGMSKTGIQGITLLAIPLMAINFGAKPSTGLILPMLCFSDLIAVAYYRRTAEWKYIWKLLPAAIAGFFLALAVDKIIPPGEFRRLMAFTIFIGIAVMFWTERTGKDSKIFTKWWYAPLFGLMGGFTTMIGNAAGPVMSVYLLSMRLPKYSFVGTSAWFFLVVNYLKIPLQVFAWENITVLLFTSMPCRSLSWLLAHLSGSGLLRKCRSRFIVSSLLWLRSYLPLCYCFDRRVTAVFLCDV